MTQETQSAMITLIIGAAVGFMFSTISTFIAHRFQVQREERNRKWQNETKQNENRREILVKRAREAEAVIELIYNITLEIANFEFDIIDKKYKKSLTGDFEDEAKAINRKIGSVVNMGDEKLIYYAEALQDLNRAELINSSKMIYVIESNSLDKAQEITRIKGFINQAASIKVNFIKRLDELLSLA